MGADQLAGAEPWQVPLALLLGAKAQDRRLHAPELSVHREQEPHVATPVPQPLHDQHRRQEVRVRAAVALRQRKSLESEPGTCQPSIARRSWPTVALDEVAVQFPTGEVDGSGASGQLLVGPAEIHQRAHVSQLRSWSLGFPSGSPSGVM